MTDLTAIDILINPDDATIARAREVNARMLRSMPEGWVLDDTDMAELTYQVTNIAHADWGFPGYGPTVLQVKVSPKVLEFQAALEAAVAPFVESGGTAKAFVADPGEVISPTIIDWVENYVPAQIGEGNYFPHLTVGVAKFDDLKIIEAEAFETSTVHAAGVAAYHLGNNGTARALLKEWPLTGV